MSKKKIKCQVFMKNRKTTLSKKNLQTQPSLTNEQFGCFSYKDQFTHRKYKAQKLRKNHRRIQTSQSQPQTLQKDFLQQLNMFRSIRENRNKSVINNLKKMKLKGQEQVKQKILKAKSIKKQIRKRILNLNQQYLRQYLYNEQPFNNYFKKLNKASNIGALNEKKIKQLKYTIKQCQEYHLSKKLQVPSSIEKKIGSMKAKIKQEDIRLQHKKIQMQIQQQFQNVYKNLDQEISRKVRNQGQFNWAIIRDHNIF